MAFPDDGAEGVGTARQMRDEKQHLMDAQARCRCSSGGIRWSIYAGKRYLSFFQRMKAPASIWVPGPETYSDFIFSGGPPVPGRIIPWYRRKKTGRIPGRLQLQASEGSSSEASVNGGGEGSIGNRLSGLAQQAAMHFLQAGKKAGVSWWTFPCFFWTFRRDLNRMISPWHPECRSREEVPVRGKPAQASSCFLPLLSPPDGYPVPKIRNF